MHECQGKKVPVNSGEKFQKNASLGYLLRYKIHKTFGAQPSETKEHVHQCPIGADITIFICLMLQKFSLLHHIRETFFEVVEC